MASSKIFAFIICLVVIKLCGNSDGPGLTYDGNNNKEYNKDTLYIISPVPDPEPDPIDIRDSLVGLFVSQIGVKQTGDNTGPEVDMYLAAVGLGPGYAWCGAFVGWGYKQLHITIPRGAAWTPNWFTAQQVIPHEQALRGDVGGIWYKSLGRIAHIVVYEEDWNNGKNSITCVEGNTNDTGSRVGNAVHRKYRNKGQINRSANWIGT